MARPLTRPRNTNNTYSYNSLFHLELRDEQIYLRSIAPHVRLTRPASEGKEKDHDNLNSTNQGGPTPQNCNEVITVEWRNVFWITARDQLLMPLLRGLVWGILGQYVSSLTPLFARRKTRTSTPTKEGRGVSWLRSWISSLTSGARIGPTSSR